MMVRLCCFLALLFALAMPASAQRGALVPLYDFKDIAVTTPTTANRMKVAIVRTALSLRWDVVEQSDGSLLVWTTKSDTYFVKLRITYDAKTYSISYVDSKELKFTDKAPLNSGYAGDRHLEKYKDLPESPFAVRTSDYIEPRYEEFVRDLLGALRRHVDAPEV